MVIEVGLSLSFLAEDFNTTCHTQNQYIIVQRHGKTTYELLNQSDEHSKFEDKADQGVFLGYSSISKAFRVFNLSRKLAEEKICVAFDEESIIHDHHSSILNVLTYSPLDPFPELLSNDVDPAIPNINQLISSQPISEDQPIVTEEAESLNQEVSAHRNTNESSNPRIIQDYPRSQIIRDINSRILTRSRVNINF
uniref:Retroviral polymerase SH3-like domain-containing protein n=1 Tax=Lactuca sativa TaxID=4236 RepID=A0A9R1VT07_LACSA|nr:hypothetical protein LSAT_V11C400207420 [Lactuca sativa]